MDVLNRYFLPIKEFFAGMTPSGRATSALLLIVAVVSLGYVFTREFGAGDGVYLLDNRLFSSDELTPMLAAFSTEGLSDFEIVGGRIRVARKAGGICRGWPRTAPCRGISVRFSTP